MADRLRGIYGNEGAPMLPGDLKVDVFPMAKARQRYKRDCKQRV